MRYKFCGCTLHVFRAIPASFLCKNPHEIQWLYIIVILIQSTSGQTSNGPEAVEKLRGSLICNVNVNVNVIWCETGKPNLDEAHMFADGIHSMFPGKPLAYNCSPSFNWKANLSDKEIAEFQKE